jgi:hypothetical protein
MNYAEQEMVANNPFTLSSMATTIEERVGRVMLKAERKAGHVGKAPLSTVIGISMQAKYPVNQKQNAKELAAYLVDNPCKGRVELATIFKCSKETIGRRATNGIRMGIILKIRTKAATCGQPTITYVAVNKGDDLTMTPKQGTMGF